MKISIFLRVCFISIILIQPAIAEQVLWLQTASPRLLKGFKQIESDLNNNLSNLRQIIRNTTGAYIDGHSVDYNDDKFKLFIRTSVLADRIKNNKKTCRTIVEQIKIETFGENRHWALEDYFPTMDKNDRRYFLKIAVTIQTYTQKDKRTGKVKEIINYSNGVPANAKVSYKTSCISNLLSEEIFFN